MDSNKINNNFANQNRVSNSTVQPGQYPNRANPPDQEHYHYHPYKKLFRSTSNKWLGGVCGGLAKYFNKDPVLIRLLWVVVTLLSFGAGVIGYILFWIFVDKEPTQFIETRQYSTKDATGAVHFHHHYRPAQ